MTLRSFINFNSALKSCIGINIHREQDESILFSFAVLSLKGKTIHVKEYKVDCKLDELTECLQPYCLAGVRIFINITGKDVLMKEVQRGDINLEQSLITNFPFFKPTEVFTQLHETGSKNYLMVMRKDAMPLPDFILNSKCLQRITLGPSVIDDVSPLLSCKRIIVYGYDVRLNGEIEFGISQHNDSPEQIEIGSDQIPARLLTAYAAAIHAFFNSSKKLEQSAFDPIDVGLETFVFRKKLFVLARIALLSILSIAILNAIMLSVLQQSLNNVESELAKVTAQAKYSTVSNELRVKKEMLFKSLGWDSNLLPLYFADQIGQLVPQTIQLSEVQIGIMDESHFRQERTIKFQNNQLVIKGECLNATVVQQFIHSIEQLEWVSGISDQRYEFNSRFRSGFFEFRIWIK